MKKIEGLIAATFAAFNEDGALNLDIIPRITNKLVEDGLTGVYVCGTNGEGPNMTTEERMQVAEAYVKAANKRLLVLVHVGHSSIADARRLATHAEQIGADAISSVAAFYFKPSSVQNLVNCMAQIASAAPTLPFYYYHIPTLTGMNMDMVEFLKLSEGTIPNLAGIKYTASTLHEYQACLNYKNGKFDILFGYDEMLLGALAVGAKGAIGSTYNFGASVYLRVMESYRNNDHDASRYLQMLSVEMVRCIVKYSSIPAQRAIMQMLGFELGPCRLPLSPLTNAEYQELKAAVSAIAFFDFAKELS